MENNLIYTDKFVLLISEDRNLDDSLYWIYDNPHSDPDNRQEDLTPTKTNLPRGWFDKLHDKEFYFSVIGYLPLSDQKLDLPLLPPIGEEENVLNILHSFGLTGEENIDVPNKPFPVKKIADAYYNRAKKDKGFSLEDMEDLARTIANKFYYLGRNKGYSDIPNDIAEMFNDKEFLSSLSSRPTSFEIEMEECECNLLQYADQKELCDDRICEKPKTIQTPDGATQLVGKYIY